MSVVCEDPPKKKIRTDDLPEAPDEDWPEAWYMPEGDCDNQKALNKKDPNEPANITALRKIGISYWKLNADAFKYPVKAVPWDPKDAVDPDLMKIRDTRGYSYADIITVHPDHLPGYEDKVKSFFEEHIHDAEEIRYVISGSGFFDVRDAGDRWVRIHVKKGDLMTLPEGMYHRFTTDDNDIIHAMRLFKGVPVWTPINRPCDEHPSRQVFVKSYMSGEEEKIKKKEVDGKFEEKNEEQNEECVQ
mmetsp:Transcript_63955/g.76895  ORF Transcript_63955/g.76895 Transcript_63955/m.76895 type:complete len:245 (-) Transcript_63955:786-1520(-)|eukprot:CAMPEP_0194352874 /NCGR_PEP_ID=MMETSP0174-20130528/1292_1 /TAXON_ID=216777 /ORGANISM="Proboscia alata, Strain PI-D3" /LENGTH=244 /DNA_ID=CAMNT_0039121187 /DNA_START=163 /DNA_END=897 /DNA_ORIENTATION=+